MAIVRVSASIIEERIFGWADHPICINSATFDPLTGYFEFGISGHDVPDTPQVTAIIHVQQNRAGERIHKMEFKQAVPIDLLNN